MKVYKNTLMHIALEQLELPTLDEMLAARARLSSRATMSLLPLRP